MGKEIVEMLEASFFQRTSGIHYPIERYVPVHGGHKRESARRPNKSIHTREQTKVLAGITFREADVVASESLTVSIAVETGIIAADKDVNITSRVQVNELADDVDVL